MINILLLTNRDSDNIGDQVIEASDISLIDLVMRNLGFQREEYKINSKAAGIVPKRYVATKEPELLENARNAIKSNDIIVFGGAPLFNYAYQIFYERTAVAIELAQEYDKPVIFSAIGIEGYDEDNQKCQRLKKTLNFDNVKRITTRDDFESLTKYKENPDLVIDKVSDPAVFSKTIFEPFINEKDPNAEKKKIGVFIIRSNAFTDNKIKFSGDEAVELWKDIVEGLEERGYDYELLTSGHFGDEAFLDYLAKNGYVPNNKCIFNMNSPEDLYREMSKFDGVISCRLHPSIISYSMDIPAVSLVWNMKVRGFYESIGYPDRMIEMDGVTSDLVIDKVEKAMEDGVSKDTDYLMSVYRNLFEGIRTGLGEKFEIDDKLSCYTYEEVLEKLEKYQGTSAGQLNEKLKRKFRRTYEKYNDNKNTIGSLKRKVKELKAEVKKNKTTRQAIKNLLHNIKMKIKKFFHMSK